MTEQERTERLRVLLDILKEYDKKPGNQEEKKLVTDKINETIKSL